MRMPASSVIIMLMAFLCLVSFSSQANAAIESANVLDDILRRYQGAATTWATTITARATWLFWLLAAISMVWTFGLMLLRRADIGEFFAEFFRFTMFTGFFWWLLINGPNFATSIFASLKQIASEASGLNGMGSPSHIIDIGFEIFYRTLDQTRLSAAMDSAVCIIVALVILVILALISVNMILLLISGWILAYAGIFFLGFGGSRWTSDIAINYYKTVLGVAVSLFAMVLLVGIGKTFLDDYYLRMNAGLSLKDMGVMMVVSVVLFALVNKIPPMLSGIVGGGGGGIGNLGGGAAIGAIATASGMAAAMTAAAFAHSSGGVSALKAAFDAAQDTMSNSGGGSMSAGLSQGSSAGGEGGSGGGGGGGGGGLGQAMSTGSRFAVNMGGHLAKGGINAVMKEASGMGSQTPGGKIASAIRENMPEPEFKGNRFANSTETTLDREAEAEAFVNSK
ncbi:MAG: P-type conjugative transfer protein TrbL [Nitrosospira sp.]